MLNISPDTPLSSIEPLSEYRPGGYHPIHIGTYLHNSRYKVHNKLGWGAICTVWLATDSHRADACVAISISRADAEGHYRKHLMAKMDHLATGDDSHPGKTAILAALDSFTITGCNGRHFALVTAFQGQTISRATNRSQGARTTPLPLRLAKKAVWDLAMGIHYMHGLGFTHNDLHPANMFLGIPDDEPWSIDKVTAITGAPKIVYFNTSIEHSKHMPRYLVSDSLLPDIPIAHFPGPFKITDFGLSFLADKQVPKMGTLGPYIVPERDIPEITGLKADIWMFGCAVYQFLSGFDLMCEFGTPALETIHGFMNVLGEPPKFVMEAWKGAFGEGNVVVPAEGAGSLGRRVSDMREGHVGRGMRCRREEFAQDDVLLITEFLRSILQFDPRERPSMEEILELPGMKYFQLEAC